MRRLLIALVTMALMGLSVVVVDYGNHPPIIERPYHTETFTITHYCPCLICCGKTNGITSIGVKATPNHTIAADPNVLPYGTEVEIDGIIYTVEDCGGSIKNNRLDIFVDDHNTALQKGVLIREVKIYD